MAMLVDPSRRALYEYVRRQDHPVSREEAADAQRISRNLAAFHLDKLVEAGLLKAGYAAPKDQPRGRGRTPKVYEVDGKGLSLTVPERRYDLIAEILADAVAEDPADAERAAMREAEQRGFELGLQLSISDTGLVALLAGIGFEPYLQAGTVMLRNCPFHELAKRQTALVCGLNHAFLNGLLRGLGREAEIRTHLVPHPSACCVQLTAA